MERGMRPNLPDEQYQRCEECAFWKVETTYGVERWPIDPHAIYGWPSLGNREDDFDVPHRTGMRNIRTAIRSVRPGDRVRVNDDTWMDAVSPDDGCVDEGFAAKFENGSVVYVVRVDNPSNRPPGTFDSPWMRRWDDHTSIGEVNCLEVEWQGRDVEDE
jgi:hypothetical protein